MKGHPGYDFSYSGLKTSVVLKVKELEQRNGGALSHAQVADLAASFREAVIDSLLTKAFKAAEELGAERVVLGGGVAANELIRNEAVKRGEVQGVKVYYPTRPLCTDNAVGTATLGYFQYKKKGPDDIFNLSYFRKGPLEKW
jgi:N6-L-threonylcarbamoyladenine synthase